MSVESIEVTRLPFISGSGKAVPDWYFDVNPDYAKAKRKTIEDWKHCLMTMSPSFNCFVTLNLNLPDNKRSKSSCWEYGKGLLEKFHRRLDKKLFGKRFYLNKLNKRTFFFAVMEFGNIKRKPHFHLLLSVPESIKMDRLEKHIKGEWTKVIQSGDAFVGSIEEPNSLLKSEMDKMKSVSYVLKDFCDETYVLSTQFSNKEYEVN